MIWQHDTARTDTDRRCPTSHVAYQHCRGGAGDARHSMVLGQPEAPVAPAFGVARQIQRIAKRLRGVASLVDGRKVEDGVGSHRTHLGMERANATVTEIVRSKVSGVPVRRSSGA